MHETGLFELNAVAAISAHRSFRAAATELGISPSALSHAIAGLEKRLGVRLINRTTRSVSLSEAGEQFLARVSPALREIAGAMEDVNAFRDTPDRNAAHQFQGARRPSDPAARRREISQALSRHAGRTDHGGPRHRYRRGRL